MNERLMIEGGSVYTQDNVIEPGWLFVEDRLISRIGSGNPPADVIRAADVRIQAEGKHVLPGFIDLHIHGALGWDVMDADPQGLRQIGQFLARHGVTSFLAATWTGPDQAILNALETIVIVYGQIPDGASLLGAYLEGPYLNPNRAGAQDLQYIRQAVDRTEAKQYLQNDLVRIVTIAPEFPENLWLIDECAGRSIAVSAGHTSASYDDMLAVVPRGVRQITHCFNAMPPLHHRQPGVVGAALTLPELRCELIADNIHVHPALQQLLYKARGSDGILLISDSIRCTGLEDGGYDLDGRKVTLKAGAVRLEDGTLAGSVLTLDRALRNFMDAVRRPLAELWPSTSLTPARAIGLAHRKGSLEPGFEADIVILDKNLEVSSTVAEGRLVYQA